GPEGTVSKAGGPGAPGPDAAAPNATGPGTAGPDAAGREAAARIAERFPGALLSTSFHRGEASALIVPERVVEVCRFLKEEPGLEFTMLVDLCATHWMDREYSYEVVYLLHSFAHNGRIRLKSRLGEEGRIATMTGVHPGADWHEREAFDLVGVVFEGHPD